jgi:hypothetical protein
MMAAARAPGERKERSMKASEKGRGRVRRGVVLAAAGLLASLGAGSASSQEAPPARAVCVFTNPAFAGKCTETADVPKGGTPAQSCQAILQCLNNVDCLKTYCQATTVRGGWRLESAKPATRAK